MKPLIGITAGYDKIKEGFASPGRYRIHKRYCQVVEAGGGIPVVVPFMENRSNLDELCSKFDGMIFSGGYDYSPDLTGEKKHPETEPLLEDRNDWEIEFCKSWLKTHKPLLGICLGIQTLTITTGGTIHQHVPDIYGVNTPHRPYFSGKYAMHNITLESNSLLNKIFNQSEIEVCSFHHQSVNKPGKGFTPVAFATDGTIEAVENPDYEFIVGVQWHPEMTPDDIYSQKLLEAFVNASRDK